MLYMLGLKYTLVARLHVLPYWIHENPDELAIHEINISYPGSTSVILDQKGHPDYFS
jgi:hypothetical protein